MSHPHALEQITAPEPPPPACPRPTPPDLPKPGETLVRDFRSEAMKATAKEAARGKLSAAEAKPLKVVQWNIGGC